jgi:hypothetical protein
MSPAGKDSCVQPHMEACKELKQHMAMNVIVPLAISLASVLKFAADKKLSAETLAYPILWEGLDLLKMKVVEDLVFQWDETLKNWMPFLQSP